MKLCIKYMVCSRCKMMVKAELEKLGLHYGTIGLGEVELFAEIDPATRHQLKVALQRIGLELMDDSKAILIEKIKKLIIESVTFSEDQPINNFSDYLNDKLDCDYAYLANLFSETTGFTIEQYIIAYKVEKIKELMLYDELNLTQISYKLNYSSVAHLSYQFKKVTGLTPTYFKQLRQKRILTFENL